eukprot:6491368-Amphidinium_carterae.1
MVVGRDVDNTFDRQFVDPSDQLGTCLLTKILSTIPLEPFELTGVCLVLQPVIVSTATLLTARAERSLSLCITPLGNPSACMYALMHFTAYSSAAFNGTQTAIVQWYTLSIAADNGSGVDEETPDGQEQEQQEAAEMKVLVTPTAEERRYHTLTHDPYKEHCVRGRGREDRRHAQKERRGAPVVQFDLYYRM